mmetsp:Transcript_21716/g.52493  ORF Transcript_21716/g.52493 Transcript_21716/m.52493 type:complete len:231 (-) Transcript_21716:871-1563(-)
MVTLFHVRRFGRWPFVIVEIANIDQNPKKIGQSPVHIFDAHVPPFQRLHPMSLDGISAVQVDPRAQCHAHRFRIRRCIAMMLVHVRNRPTVGDDIAAKIPLVAQSITEEGWVRACRDSVDGVVRAHSSQRAVVFAYDRRRRRRRASIDVVRRGTNSMIIMVAQESPGADASVERGEVGIVPIPPVENVRGKVEPAGLERVRGKVLAGGRNPRLPLVAAVIVAAMMSMGCG